MPVEARAYRMLLRVPTASATELADRLGMSLMDVRACLRVLEAKGLVGRLPGARHRFQAAPPDQAFGPLVRRRHRELRTFRSDAGALTHEYHNGGSRHHVAESIELIAGASSMRRRCRELVAGATSEVCVLVAGGETAFVPPDPETLRSGVRSRVVYPRWMLTGEDSRHALAGAIRAGQRVRVVGRPSVNLLLADRAVALVPVLDDWQRSGHDPAGTAEPGGTGHGAVIVHPGGLQDALLALFESTWAVAAPLLVTDGGDVYEDLAVATPSADDLRLLGLMLDGLTDQAIAGKMGVGTRTVQRRVSDLIELAGVRTRLQLIWQATQRGWI